MGHTIYTSATPGPYEMGKAEQVVEQIIRPTGLVDPEVEVRPTTGQVDNLVGEIRQRVENGERVLVTTLTKRMAEDLSEYLQELGMKVHYLHSEVETLERVGILRDLRLGVFDVLVGINLLREGLDLPEEPDARTVAPDPRCVVDPILEVNMKDAGITSIIWATGYALDFSWVRIDAFDEKGRPKHDRGVSVVPGLYFLGLPWLSRRASSFIWGVWRDAEYLAGHIAA